MNDTITIYKQIYPAQCPTLVKLGYCSVINIRPDGECDNQPSSDALATAAKQAKLNYVYLPYDCERLSRQTIEAFAKQYHALPKPVMLFCGTGNRAKLLYQSAVMQGLI